MAFIAPKHEQQDINYKILNLPHFEIKLCHEIMITSKALASEQDSSEGKPAHSESFYNLTDLYLSNS